MGARCNFIQHEYQLVQLMYTYTFFCPIIFVSLPVIFNGIDKCPNYLHICIIPLPINKGGRVKLIQLNFLQLKLKVNINIFYFCKI